MMADDKRTTWADRSQLVHEWAGVWVVAEPCGAGLYRGVSHGKALVTFGKRYEIRKTHKGELTKNDSRLREALRYRVLSETEDRAEVLVIEECGHTSERGEEVIGSLGELAEAGCWYKTEESARAAARRWTVYGRSRAALALAV